MPDYLSDIKHEFLRYKSLIEKAMTSLSDEAFFLRPGPEVNPVALIVKHIAGNFASRWTDFLTSDGEKPDRNRDGEFVILEGDSRERLMAAWERGWSILFQTLDSLEPSDLDRTITIRGESQTASQALLRSVAHTSYHAGQILYLVRLLKPDSPWLTIAPGKSAEFQAAYRKS
jgi:uncharacterized damage-inducible protein DinB